MASEREVITQLLADLPARTEPAELSVLADAVRLAVAQDLEHGIIERRRTHPVFALDDQYRELSKLAGTQSPSLSVLRQLRRVYRRLPERFNLGFDRDEDFGPSSQTSARGDLEYELGARWTLGDTTITYAYGGQWAFETPNAGFIPKLLRELGGRSWWLVDDTRFLSYEALATATVHRPDQGRFLARLADVTTAVEPKYLDPRVNRTLNTDVDFVAISARVEGGDAHIILDQISREIERLLNDAHLDTLGEALSTWINEELQPEARDRFVRQCRLLACGCWRTYYELWLYHPNGLL